MLLLISSSFLQHNPLTGLQRDDVTLGAGDGTRTRDSLLGRQELYQLSYSRMVYIISLC